MEEEIYAEDTERGGEIVRKTAKCKKKKESGSTKRLSERTTEWVENKNART